MSARTLRLLISAGVVFIFFVYLLSTQVKQALPVKSPEEGLPGGPVPGLTRWQLSKFEEGRALFRKSFGLQDGLGPLYNGTSCVECHGEQSTAGGASPVLPEKTIALIARRKQAEKAAAAPAPGSRKVEFKDLDLIFNSGSPVLLRKSITDLKNTTLSPDCKIEVAKTIPKAEFHGKRLACPLSGLGWVDTIPDDVFRFQAGRELRLNKEIAGRAVEGCVPYYGGNSVGRFGDRAQEANLLSFIAQELGTEIGISNELCRHTFMPGGLQGIPDCLKKVCPADPNDDGRLAARINFYLHTLTPPPGAPVSVAANRGRTVFQRLGCGFCHTELLQTANRVSVVNPDGPFLKTEELPAAGKDMPAQLRTIREPAYVEVRALENKPIRAFSDFLVHDMGSSGDDGIAQPGTRSNEWRTAPLWGICYRKSFLHDGRAESLEKAILLHDGQGATAARAFRALSQDEKSNLIAFLKSL